MVLYNMHTIIDGDHHITLDSEILFYEIIQISLHGSQTFTHDGFPFQYSSRCMFLLPVQKFVNHERKPLGYENERIGQAETEL